MRSGTRPPARARSSWRQRQQERQTGEAYVEGYQAGAGDTERYWRDQIAMLLRAVEQGGAG
jgi:hypothetical protein